MNTVHTYIHIYIQKQHIHTEYIHTNTCKDTQQSVHTFVASAGLLAIRLDASVCARSSFASSAPRLARMAPLSFSFSSWSAITLFCSDSSRNFLRTRDLFACSRLRSLGADAHGFRIINACFLNKALAFKYIRFVGGGGGRRGRGEGKIYIYDGRGDPGCSWFTAVGRACTAIDRALPLTYFKIITYSQDFEV